jgi:glycosyltransferase involved in cell wall biosynthesis
VRLLLLNQFYPPDVAPTGQFLHDLAGCLAARGHDVHVVCSRRSYDGWERHPGREERDGVHVRRVAALGFGRGRALGRLADYASYLGLAGLEALLETPRPDVVLAQTTPPYLGLLGAGVARLRGSAFVQWVMDVYPEVLAAHRLARPGGMVYRMLQVLTRRQLARARAVVALGPVMAERLGAYLQPDARLEWVPLWGMDGPANDQETKARREAGWAPDELVFLYSGNLGFGHRFGEFLEAARRLGPAGPLWAFAGTGVRRAEVEAFALAQAAARIRLLPPLDRERLPSRLAAADVHLVSLSSGWQGLIVPSKLQAAFSVGRPVIYVGPPDSDLALWIRESDGGWLVAENDVAGLLSAVAEACRPDERARRGDAGRAYARAQFDRARNTERMAGILEGLA